MLLGGINTRDCFLMHLQIDHHEFFFLNDNFVNLYENVDVIEV